MLNFNEASCWRYELARQVMQSYRRNPRVLSGFLTGSVARNCADHYSDIELGLVWQGAPTEKERLTVITTLGGQFNQFYPYEQATRSWSEDYLLRGVKMDVRHWSIEGLVQTIADVVERLESGLPKQEMLAALQHGLPLYGETSFAQWQSTINAYPHELAIKLVQEHFLFKPCWGKEMLVERGDLLLLYSSICTAEQQILLVLLALNHRYYPGLKWLDRTIGDLVTMPAHLALRMKTIFTLPPDAAVLQLHTLIRDVLDLLEQHMPEVNTSRARQWFEWRRPMAEHAPAGIVEQPEL